VFVTSAEKGGRKKIALITPSDSRSGKKRKKRIGPPAVPVRFHETTRGKRKRKEF